VLGSGLVLDRPGLELEPGSAPELTPKLEHGLGLVELEPLASPCAAELEPLASGTQVVAAETRADPEFDSRLAASPSDEPKQAAAAAAELEALGIVDKLVVAFVACVVASAVALAVIFGAFVISILFVAFVVEIGVTNFCRSSSYSK